MSARAATKESKWVSADMKINNWKIDEWESYGLNTHPSWRFQFCSSQFSSLVLSHFIIDRLLVGAPLSNVTSAFGGETLEKYGTVFKCEYKPNSKSCTEIAVDHRRKSIWSKLVFVYLSITLRRLKFWRPALWSSLFTTSLICPLGAEP